MHSQSKADVFIRTLTEVYDDVREHQIARLHIKHKAASERFMQKFRPESNSNRQSMDRAMSGELTEK